MEIKDRTAGEYSLEVFDSISDIPYAEDGQLGVDKQLAFICYEGSIQLRIGERTYDAEASIKEIAAEMDFPNASFFGRYVKGHLGCTPMEYRERFN